MNAGSRHERFRYPRHFRAFLGHAFQDSGSFDSGVWRAVSSVAMTGRRGVLVQFYGMRFKLRMPQNHVDECVWTADAAPVVVPERRDQP